MAWASTLGKTEKKSPLMMATTCDSEKSHEDSIRDLTVLNSYMIWSSCGSKTDQYSAV
jgi:hypothetical protein